MPERTNEEYVKEVYPLARCHSPLPLTYHYIWNWAYKPETGGGYQGLISDKCDTEELAWESAASRLPKEQS